MNRKTSKAAIARRPRIAIDAMGGDGGVATTVAAALELVDLADLTLVGNATDIQGVLPSGSDNISVQHAGEVITPGDTLADVLRHKPNSSMRQALALHARGSVDGVVSGGDTGALMALARQQLHMVPGIERPAILKKIEGISDTFWMLDLGANIDSSPEQLFQFAQMGSLLASSLGGKPQPRIALLNIGTERRKGPEVLQKAAQALADDPDLEYVGFIEANRLFLNHADVVVCDGFTGNIALKSMEGAALMAGHLLKQKLNNTRGIAKFTMGLVRQTFRELRDELNPQQYNGASFVGLNGVVIKSHGGADAFGFLSALKEAVLEIESEIPERLAVLFQEESS
ncbi:MAG: phosphate acyltransferase PlsX [Gammaproteobacteria bacterium]|nr:phosphate acyltransferase PlsX [Gammaproteobacteria bacterium]